jgi:MFS family permease
MWLQLLTLGWFVRHLSQSLDNSTLLVVGIGGTVALPGILIGPWGGVLGDRMDRRKLLITLEAFMIVMALSFAFLVKAGLAEIWHAYAYALVAGSCESVKMPLRQALIANTVPKDAISNAYATSVITIPGTRMIGPFIGGLIVASFGFFWNFLIEAGLYLGVVIALLPMKIPYYIGIRTATPVSGFSGVFSDVIDGFRYLWSKQRSLSLLMVLSASPNIICHPVIFLLPMYTVGVLGQGVDYGGYLMAVNGAGGFIMVFMLSAFGFPRMRGMLCIIAAILSSVLTFSLSQSTWIPSAFLILALFGATQTAYRTTNGVMTQTLVDDEYRVRVMSVYRVVMGMVVFFSLLVGWFADVTSPRWALSVMGVLGLVLSGYFLIGSSTVRRQE